MAQARDLMKELRSLYDTRAAARRPHLVKVPPLNCLMVDGRGDPNSSPDFPVAMEALFTGAYTLKFDRKKRGAGPDFKVMPPEGLWWMADGSEFDAEAKGAWAWTLLIVLPEFLRKKDLAAAVAAARQKKDNPMLGLLRLEILKEGLCGQVLHIGPYSAEGPVVAGLHAFLAEQGLQPRGKHHEIYLSDVRRLPPEKWKTMIRQRAERVR
jgi:hypothetical protein